MMKMPIPGYGNTEIEHLVSDCNGAPVCDEQLLPGVITAEISDKNHSGPHPDRGHFARAEVIRDFMSGIKAMRLREKV